MAETLDVSNRIGVMRSRKTSPYVAGTTNVSSRKRVMLTNSAVDA